ncbi:MAG: T9SS type A sorting domain-containing protein, partial [Bacteroidales bacterium]|nr:T9SS type A sorting domain-containing protein [Bacteroidales bacterium]
EITNTRRVTISFDDGGGEAQLVAISNSSDFSLIGQEYYTSTKEWLLTEGFGEKTIYVKFYNKQGNPSEVVTDTIEYSLVGEDGFTDIDKDGDFDVVVTSSNDGMIYLFENLDGNGDFDAGTVIGGDHEGIIRAVAVDLDYDLDLDIVALSDDDDCVAYYENITLYVYDQPEDIDTCPDTEEVNVSINVNDVLTYQWQMLNEDSFVDLQEDEYHIGVTTPSLLVKKEESAILQGTYRCELTNSVGSQFSEAMTIDAEDNVEPNLICQDFVVGAMGAEEYTVVGDEFDPISISDNCNIEYVQNTVNGSGTLAGVDFLPGVHYIEWEVYDGFGNYAYAEHTVTVTHGSGINDESITALDVYPNPANSNIYVNTENYGANICIYNIAGVLVYQENVEASKLHRVNVDEFESGTYLMKIHSSDGSMQIEKIIKQ